MKALWKTLKMHMKVKMPNYNKYIYRLEDLNGNGEFGEGDDLRKDVKVTIGEYLSNLTKTSSTKNGYTISPDFEESPSFNQVTQHTPPIVTGQGSGETTYLNQVTDAAHAYFESINESDYGGHDNPLMGLIDKTLRSAHHGEVLSGIEGGTIDDHKVKKKISKILQNNRFNPGGESPYIQDGKRSKSYGYTQKVMGEYNGDENVDNQKVSSYEIEDLQNIAMSLLLKASGRLNEKDNPSEFDSGNILYTNVSPATVRIGNVKLGPGDLEARNAYKGAELTAGGNINSELRDEEIHNTTGFFNFNTPGSSYGQMFSPLESFAPTGAYSPSPIALLVPQFTAIAASTSAVGLIMSILTAGHNSDGVATETDVLPYGKSKKSVSKLGAVGDLIKRMLNIPETKEPFITSIPVGLLWFQAASVFGGAGFVVSVQRSVARDSITFMEQIANNDAFSGSPLSIVNSIGIIVNSLISSKFFRFIVSMAVLGDKIITGSWKKSKNYNYGLVGKANVDELPNNARYRVMKSRKNIGEKGLVWAAGNIPSAYVLPAVFKDRDQTRVKDVFINNSLSEKLIDPKELGHAGPRLSADFVENVENLLEVEYVPFYFHDLRTNEIIAFHAFISDISDSYSATWAGATGIGRVEPAYIYGGTTRSISLGFHIISTNSGDFDEMWYKINKLITLVYPQFSKGRVLTNDKYKFTQPFSQVQTASPLVRIRLGDIFKTNYSKFSLARLFGAGNDLKLNDHVLEAPNPDVEKKYREIVKAYDPSDDKFKPLFFFGPGDKIIIPTNTAINVSDAIGGTIPEFKVQTQLIGTIVGLPIPIVTNTEDPSPVPPSPPNAAPVPPINFKYNIEFDDDSNKEIDSAPWRHPFSTTLTAQDFKIDKDYAWELAKANVGEVEGENYDYQEAYVDFFSEKNSIVRSFESTRGRGLAGAITDMQFKWNDNMWATEEVGSKGPQSCHVTITFKPIHDITPGLDSEGFNRAPVYNVGKVMNAIGDDAYGNIARDLGVRVKGEIEKQKSSFGTTISDLKKQKE